MLHVYCSKHPTLALFHAQEVVNCNLPSGNLRCVCLAVTIFQVAGLACWFLSAADQGTQAISTLAGGE